MDDRGLNYFANQSAVCLNIHTDGYRQLPHRMQNMLAAGAFVISEPLTHDDDLIGGIHYVAANGVDGMRMAAESYLADEKRRIGIAAEGCRYVCSRFDAEKEWIKLIESL
jgi:hypothetical protein